MADIRCLALTAADAHFFDLEKGSYSLDEYKKSEFDRI
jgi:hypothetical protein